MPKYTPFEDRPLAGNLLDILGHPRDFAYDNEHIMKLMQGRFVQDILVDRENEEITFLFLDCKVKLHHHQDCCESVVIDDINGDFEDLNRTILLVAEERVSDEPEEGDKAYDSDTWTFYTFRSLKGSVDVKWHGSSNGYYSESVNISVETL